MVKGPVRVAAVDAGPGVQPVPLAGHAAGPAASAGVYGISVAAELAGCGIQALRIYEQRGLLEPARTPGGTRRYSLDNIHRVQRITGLLESGLNLAGIIHIFQLEAELAEVKAELARVKSAVEASRKDATAARKR
jgi:MerR family transcriptional regulator, heat shock protein HspR